MSDKQLAIVLLLAFSAALANGINMNQRLDIDALEDRIEVLEGKINE